MLQRHVDLDGGVAGDGRGNPRANFFHVQRLLFARKLIEQLVQHVLDLRSLDARRSDFDSDASRPKRFGLEAILVKFFGDLSKHGLLGRREFEQQRHEQALAFYFLRGPLLQDLFKQYAFVSDVLIDDPKALVIHREDERLANLSQRLERRQRWGEVTVFF